MDAGTGEVLPLTVFEEVKIDKTRVVVSTKVARMLHNGRKKKLSAVKRTRAQHKRERQNKKKGRQ